MLSEDKTLFELRGNVKGKNMYSKHGDNLLMFDANIPDKNSSEFKAVEDYFDKYLKQVKLLEPKIIVESVGSFNN